MKEIIIVLDSLEYKIQEEKLKLALIDICNPIFVYTKYENQLTELFQKTKYIGVFFTHITYWSLSLFYALNMLKYRKVKTIVCINPIVGIFYAALIRILGIHQTLTIAGFLFEPKKSHLYYNLRKEFVKFCYKKVDKIILYGESEKLLYSEIFKRLAEKFVFVQYGKDYNYTNIKTFEYPYSYISSGGRSNRDYQILCKAMKKMEKVPQYDCLVATRPECVTPAMINCGVKFVYGITLNQFGSFIKGSKLFVLPLKNTTISAGHMSMMEAMSIRIPVIVTDIPAVRDYVNEDCVFFHRADDADDLRIKIEYVMSHLESSEVQTKIENAWNLYHAEYSFQSLLKRIISVSAKK